MIWDFVIVDAILPMLEADDALFAALGGPHIYAAQASRPVRIPSVEWVLTDDVLEEVFNPIEIQFDLWARGVAEGATIEGRLRALLHRDTRRSIAGIDMSTQYVDSHAQEYPEPGIVSRSLRFKFAPLRIRAAVAES